MSARSGRPAAVIGRIVAEATRLDPAGFQFGFGLRCAAGVAIVLVGSLATGHRLEGASAAVGAFIVGFASRQGVYRTRAAAMLVTGGAMSAATFVASVAGAHLVTNVAATLVFGFVAGLVAALGPVATTAGLNSLVALAIFSQFHEPPLRALGLAGLVFGGGLVQTVLLVAVWPLARSSAERKVLAAAYRGLAAYAGDFPRAKLRSPDAAAFTAVSAALDDPQPFARRGEIAAFEALLVEAERIRASLGALAVDLYGHDRAGRHDAAAAVVALGEGVGTILVRIAESLERAGTPSDYDDAWESLDERAARAERRAPLQTARDVRALLGQLRSAWRAAETPANDEIVTAVPLPKARRPSHARDALRTLRANLSPTSAFAQHGLRLALTMSAAVVLAHVLPLERGYWVVLTAVLVLRPDFATTFTRGVARLLGTLLGAVIASLVALALPGTDAYLVAALAFATIGFMVFNVNYAVFTTAVTSYVVFLLAFGGFSERAALADRVEASLVGGVLALVAYAFWPTWERAVVAARLATLIEAQRAYGSLVLAAYVGGGASGDIRARQIESWRARSNAEASVDRMLAEPVAPTGVSVRAALGVLGSSRRFGLAALTLQARLANGMTPFPEADALATAIDGALDTIASALRSRSDPATLPPLRELHAVLTQLAGGDHDAYRRAFVTESDLMVDSLNAIADVLHRLHAPSQTDVRTMSQTAK